MEDMSELVRRNRRSLDAAQKALLTGIDLRVVAVERSLS
jgi:hypothetical protein